MGHQTKSGDDARLKLTKPYQELFAIIGSDGKSEKRIVADSAFTKVDLKENGQEQLGPIIGEFYAFDRDKPVLEVMAEAKSLTDFLDENGGVRVYG